MKPSQRSLKTVVDWSTVKNISYVVCHQNSGHQNSGKYQNIKKLWIRLKLRLRLMLRIEFRLRVMLRLRLKLRLRLRLQLWPQFRLRLRLWLWLELRLSLELSLKLRLALCLRFWLRHILWVENLYKNFLTIFYFKFKIFTAVLVTNPLCKCKHPNNQLFCHIFSKKK